MDDNAIGILAAVAIIGAVGAVLVAINSGPEHDYATMCQDSNYIRLEDSACDRGDSGSFVMFIATDSQYHAPAVGGKIDQSKVIKSIPSSKTYQKGGISASGGVVKSSPGIIRGGFGGKAGSSGG